MNKTVTVHMNVAVITDDTYHMPVILIDCQGNTKVIELDPSTVFETHTYYAPCAHCGYAILQDYWYGDFMGHDCCARCGVTTPESKPTTREEAEQFLISCMRLFGGAFHPDNGGKEYVDKDDARTFTDYEAAIYDDNMNAAFEFFNDSDTDDGNIYAWCMLYLDAQA